MELSARCHLFVFRCRLAICYRYYKGSGTRGGACGPDEEFSIKKIWSNTEPYFEVGNVQKHYLIAISGLTCGDFRLIKQRRKLRMIWHIESKVVAAYVNPSNHHYSFGR